MDAKTGRLGNRIDQVRKGRATGEGVVAALAVPGLRHRLFGQALDATGKVGRVKSRGVDQLSDKKLHRELPTNLELDARRRHLP